MHPKKHAPDRISLQVLLSFFTHVYLRQSLAVHLWVLGTHSAERAGLKLAAMLLASFFLVKRSNNIAG